jgi:serine/threonine protein kinase
MPSWSTVGGGRIDVSLMASKLLKNPLRNDDVVLLAMLEVKKSITSSNQRRYIAQTVCYMASALAFSRWGMLKKPEPLVALLISPTSLWRISLFKAQNAVTRLEIKIEKTEDLRMMEWVLFKYVESYVNEQRQIIPVNIISPHTVNSLDWAPLNLDGSKWISFAGQPNMGFLFRTSRGALVRVCTCYRLTTHLPTAIQPCEIPPGTRLVVKHTSILLDADYVSGINVIQLILMSEEMFKTTLFSSISFGVVHPYYTIIGPKEHPFIIMKFMGKSLSDLMQLLSFRKRWAKSLALRNAFFWQVGMSALKLIENVKICHNDIRPPNIALSGDSFCLIDFDMSRSQLPDKSNSAFVPIRSFEAGILEVSEQMMCFSVAQIILTVFMLCSPTVFSMAEVTQADSVWDVNRDSSSKVDREFEGWVQGKGGVLLEFVNAVRGSSMPFRGPTSGSDLWPPALRADCQGFCIDVLKHLLA